MHFLLTIAQRFCGPFLWFLLAAAAVTGFVALVNPKLFQALVSHGGRWIDTSRFLAILDKRFDVDRWVLPYSRVLGAMVLLAVMLIGFLYILASQRAVRPADAQAQAVSFRSSVAP